MRIASIDQTSKHSRSFLLPATLAIAALFLAPCLASAQAAPSSTAPTVATAAAPSEAAGGDPFSQGERVGFAALSLGTHGTTGNLSVPPLRAGFDYAFHKYMTAGGIVEFARYAYFRESLTYITLAGRGTFHPIMWFKGMKVPLDPYGVATLGYTHAVWSGPGGAGYSFLVVGPSVGVRYWFTPNLSGQAESGLGNGLSLLSIGLAMRL